MSKIIFNNKLYERLKADEKDSRFNKHFENIESYIESILNTLKEINSKYDLKEVVFVDEVFDYNKYLNLGKISTDSHDFAYLFLAPPLIGGRNAFVSQQVFPGLSRIIDKFIDAPFYNPANMPVYFINGSVEEITDYMKTSIICIYIMGIRYVDLFEGRVDLTEYQNLSLYEFSKLLNGLNNYNDKIIETDYFDYDYLNNIIIFKTKSFDNRKDLGSGDRFFVTRAYPALILARKANIKIDVSNIEKYLFDTNKGKSNFGPFIDYANKLSE